MTTINDVYLYLQQLSPLSLQMDFDNAGFQLGRAEGVVSKTLLALDVTPEVADEAIKLGAELIVTHHPLIFKPVKVLDDEKILRLVESKISVISMHTNLDIAPGGVNDVLLGVFGLEAEGCFDKAGCGRFANLPHEMPMEDFLPLCKEKLGTTLRYVDSGRPVSRLAVLGGAGADEQEEAFEAGCDTFLTADVKYHQFLLAKELGINLIDGDHFCTENFVIPVLRDKLSAQFNDVKFSVSQAHRQTVKFY